MTQWCYQNVWVGKTLTVQPYVCSVTPTPTDQIPSWMMAPLTFALASVSIMAVYVIFRMIKEEL